MSYSRPNNRTQEYMRTQVETATPLRLVVMLYDGAIRFLSVGREQMAANDMEGKNTSLIKAQRIITELSATLNHEIGGEISANLQRLYSYMFQRLVEANLRDDPKIIDEVVSQLRELREAWISLDQVHHSPSREPLHYAA